MTANPFFIETGTTVVEAFELMKEKKVSKLPVMKKGKIVGIVTKELLLKVSPSSATTLSVYEINYILSKTKISDVMETNFYTVSSEDLIEKAALIMEEKDISSILVVDNNELVGIITKNDIFNAFIEIMGYKDKGSRIAMDVEDKPGNLAKIATITAAHRVNIIHLSRYQHEIVFTVNTINTSDLVNDFEKAGFKNISVFSVS